MMNEPCAGKPIDEKSLINSLENLESKVTALIILAEFSDDVVEKFNTPRPLPRNDEAGVCNKTPEAKIQRDLIDLFNSVAEDIDIATNRIGSNIEKVKSIIG